MNRPLNRYLSALIILFTSSAISGCGGDMSDLEQWVADKKAEPVRFIPDVPTVTPYVNQPYTVQELRSPFQPNLDESRDTGVDPTGGPSPIPGRNREHLEKFSLDSLRMVGSLNSEGRNSALVQTNDGLIHRVGIGNYMGENEGRVISINDSAIELVELVPDGVTGGWFERDAGIGLSD